MINVAFLCSPNPSMKLVFTVVSGCMLQEVVHKDGTPKVTQFTVPTLAVPSVYHEVIPTRS